MFAFRFFILLHDHDIILATETRLHDYALDYVISTYDKTYFDIITLLFKELK